MEISSQRRSFPFWVASVLLLALLVRVLAAFYWHSTLDSAGERFRFGDSETYWVLAEKLCAGETYQYASVDSRAFRAPGYPLFLAATIFFSQLLGGLDSVLVARLAGCVVGVTTIAMLMAATFVLAKRYPSDGRFAEIASLSCGILAALYLGGVGMSIFILSEAVFCPLMILSLIAWNRSQDAATRSRCFAFATISGFATGAACLCRPSWLLWPGLLALICFLQWLSLKKQASDSRLVQSLVSLSMFTMGMIIIMSPWWIRNYQVFHAFVPTTLQVGASLYDGLHEGATGASDEGMRFTLQTENELREFDRRWHAENDTLIANQNGDLSPKRLVPFEIRLNQALFSKAISWARENPYATGKLALIKFVKMWTPWPTAKEIGGFWVRLVEAIGYLTIGLLAIIGLSKMDPMIRFPAIIYASPVLYYAVLHTIFVGSVRYRQPAILALTIVAGIGAAWMLNQIESIRKRQD